MLRVEAERKLINLANDWEKGDISGPDLLLLEEYRLTFSKAYQAVVATIRARLDLEPTGRESKSTTSIAEKLREKAFV